ncbi:aldo/keto reductase [Kockovaella imperatae]|uniref:Aldo/keto reductase n=1 Tax=Kockovaella imperatae TaxID=4999 RepID=A0A1Y1UNG9_9TREE|nr:aldo/keto reductase [Kockovaella imperatae]ORX39608.1 aldo/keto reductase [Kockovaella imperatae]
MNFLQSLSTNGPMEDEQCFETLKHAIDRAGPGEKVVINSSEHYGANAANLELLSRFFTRYPETKDKAFVVVKGGLGIFNPGSDGHISPDSSPEGLRRSAEGIAKKLHPKKVDVLGPGRLDGNHSVEEVIKTLVELQKEGLFLYIGLSEVSSSTLRKASAISQIVTVETEVSPLAWEEETRKVFAVAEETRTVILAYSPLGRGALSGKSYEEIPKHVRDLFPRFHEENWEENKKIGEKIKALAEKKGVSVGQLTLAWVSSTSPQVIPIPGTTMLYRASENFDAMDVELNSEERQEVDAVLESTTVKGGRYPDAYKKFTWS